MAKVPVRVAIQPKESGARHGARRLTAMALSLALAAYPAAAAGADRFGGRGETEGPGAFAGVRFQALLPRASAPPPRLGFTVGPTVQWDTADGVRQVRYAEGFTLTGKRDASGRLTLKTGADCEGGAGSRDGAGDRACGGFPAWGYVALAAGALAVGYVVLTEVCEAKNCANSD